MKVIIYKVQTDFKGNKLPTISEGFLTYKEAKENFDKQRARTDCSFCNLVKVEAKVMAGDECAEYEDNFRFCI